MIDDKGNPTGHNQDGFDGNSKPVGNTGDERAAGVATDPRTVPPTQNPHDLRLSDRITIRMISGGSIELILSGDPHPKSTDGETLASLIEDKFWGD